MLTRLRGADRHKVVVASFDEDVQVFVDCQASGLPKASLSRTDIHDALIKAKTKAEDFIAAVEGDIQATEP